MIVAAEALKKENQKQEHKECSIKVYFTRDYDRFKKLLGNRKLNQSKINKILKDMANGLNVLKYFPILVNEEMEILDGQHRFHVAKKRKDNVYYIIAKKDFALVEIASVNSRTEKWKPRDFIDCYIQLGNSDYQTLKDFVKKYQFSVTDSVNLLQTGNAKSNKEAAEFFKSGKFAVNHEQEANIIAELINRFSFFPYFRGKSFIRAIQQINEAGICDFDRLIEQVKKRQESFSGKVTVKEYLAQLELFYNHKLKSRVRIY